MNNVNRVCSQWSETVSTPLNGQRLLKACLGLHNNIVDWCSWDRNSVDNDVHNGALQKTWWGWTMTLFDMLSWDGTVKFHANHDHSKGQGFPSLKVLCSSTVGCTDTHAEQGSSSTYDNGPKTHLTWCPTCHILHDCSILTALCKHKVLAIAPRKVDNNQVSANARLL